MARIALRDVFNLTKSPTPPTAAFLDKVHQQLVRALDPKAGPFLVGYDTVVGNEAYLIVSLNGDLDDTTAVGLEYDPLGADPILYIAVPAGSVKVIGQTFIFPRLTTVQRDALAAPVRELASTIYNTTTNKLNFWDGAAWRVVTSV